ncbi:hypothetical protein [Burkholderia multivorans]|uniref:hypothetical protein n=1 Tax=Burkholderia multivorans TaxID=87883 RepID=UPI0020199D54|nr:hypothetical protein [Burkholderia multivorans]MCO1402864.1 hypothetical protein [Burkholderia multivorans]UQO79082.1 hypothetical protein L0Z12_06140 [Burkholderia multivorans]
MQPEFDPRFTLTLDALRKAGACYHGYNKLVRSLQGETFSAEDAARNSYIHFKHDAEIPLVDVLNSNGLDDALWALRCVSGAGRDIRLFAIWCARQVEHLMQDQRSKDALDVAERFANGGAADEELDAAWAAAWAAAQAARAARAAAQAARAAARAAAGGAAGDAQAEMFKRMCLGTAPWQQVKVAA